MYLIRKTWNSIEERWRNVRKMTTKRKKKKIWNHYFSLSFSLSVRPYLFYLQHHHLLQHDQHHTIQDQFDHDEEVSQQHLCQQRNRKKKQRSEREKCKEESSAKERVSIFWVRYPSLLFNCMWHWTKKRSVPSAINDMGIFACINSHAVNLEPCSLGLVSSTHTCNFLFSILWQ